MLFPKTEKPSPALKGEGTHRDTPSTLSLFTKSSSHLSDSDLVTPNVCSHALASAADRSWLNGFFVLGNELQFPATDAVLCADGSRHTTVKLKHRTQMSKKPCGSFDTPGIFGVEGCLVKASSYMIDYAFDMADYLHLHPFCVLPRACFARTWRTLIQSLGCSTRSPAYCKPRGRRCHQRRGDDNDILV